MNIFARLKNIWSLSEFKPRTLGSEPVKDGTPVAMLIKSTQKAVFFPRVLKDPVKEITQEEPYSTWSGGAG